MKMTNKIKEPTVTTYIDDDEQALIDDIENNAHKSVTSSLAPEKAKAIQEMAKKSIDNKKKLISIRIQEEDLRLIKMLAKKEGMPYQTLINSILHKAVTE